MTTKRDKPTYLSTASNAALLKLIDMAYSLAAKLDREHAEELGHLLSAIRHTLPDNPRAFGGHGDVTEMLESKVIRSMGITNVNRARRDQGKPTLSNMRPAKPVESKPPAVDSDDPITHLVAAMRAMLPNLPAGVAEPLDDEPHTDERDDAPPCRAYQELSAAIDSVELLSDLDAWLADGGDSDEDLDGE